MRKWVHQGSAETNFKRLTPTTILKMNIFMRYREPPFPKWILLDEMEFQHNLYDVPYSKFIAKEKGDLEMDIKCCFSLVSSDPTKIFLRR